MARRGFNLLLQLFNSSFCQVELLGVNLKFSFPCNAIEVLKLTKTNRYSFVNKRCIINAKI